MNAQYLKDTANHLWQSYNYVLNGQASDSDIERWLQLAQAALLDASHLAESQSLSIADKNKLQAAVSVIRSVIRLLTEHLSNSRSPAAGFIGGELPAATSNVQATEIAAQEKDVGLEKEPVCWDEINSAFENRIRTAVITNIKHLDVTKFLQDAQQQFVTQI